MLAPMLNYRVLGSRVGDHARLEAFLRTRLTSSMILFSHARSAGLRDRGQRSQGTYLGVFEDDALMGVVGHLWNGSAVLQVPAERAAALCELAIRVSGRPLTGLLGPAEQVGAVLYGLDLAPAQLRLDSVESLFELRLSRLRVPAALSAGAVRVRVARPADVAQLTAWRVAFCIEALHAQDTPELYEASRYAEWHSVEDGHSWIVECEGKPVAKTAFSAATRELVQVGGVYTPPTLRGRGYARAGVAQTLLEAKRRGALSSVLFTGDDNLAAQRAYRALGYERIGDYRITTLNTPWSWPGSRGRERTRYAQSQSGPSRI
jgi:RimJ/RimL family protein N-acetyltransferase